jgi:hypothetical protein
MSIRHHCSLPNGTEGMQWNEMHDILVTQNVRTLLLTTIGVDWETLSCQYGCHAQYFIYIYDI